MYKSIYEINSSMIPMNVSIRQLRAFMAVARRRSFSRAAEDLNVSQPALSARIRELEQELGLKLFGRTTRSVELTSSGDHLLVRADRALSELDAVILELHDQATLQRGRVAVACVPAVAVSLIPRAIKRFTTAHPGVQVEFTEITSSQVEAKVLEGAVDFGVCGRTSRQRELDLELILRDPFVAVVPKVHPLARRRWVTLPMLQRYPLIMMRRGSNVRSEIETAFDACGVPLKPVYETTHHISVIGMVEAGLGVGVLPSMTVSGLRTSAMRIVKVASPTAVAREIGIVTRHGSASSPAALQLMDSIREAAASVKVAQ